MTQDKSPGRNDAFALFPDLMKNVAKSPLAPLPSPPPKRHTEIPVVATNRSIAPPPPPDIRWLSEGGYQKKTQISKGPTALLLMTGDGQTEIAKTFQGLGYSIEVAGSQSEAIQKVTTLDFAAIVADAGFMGTPLTKSPFHRFMKWLPMPRRRPIHYTFIGPQAHTLYCLEALSASVNMVVNEDDIKHFDVILRKGLLEHNTLFQPYMTILAQHKKDATP